MKKRIVLGKLVVFLSILLLPSQIHAFWVVNFGTASTLRPGLVGFAAGLGGQLVFVGQPRTTNAFFMIPHAGFRYGLAERFDVGLRLAPVPLPFSSVGPGFGMNIDVKFHLTERDDKWQFALVGGIGGAHVLFMEQNRLAWSHNAAVLTTYQVNERTAITMMGRFVHLAIPTAPEGGAQGNMVNIAGASVGLKRNITDNISILPEVGAYWYEGRMGSGRMSGPGFQYGLMLATSF